MNLFSTSVVSVLVCLGIYFGGVDLFQSDAELDLSGTLFMAFTVYMLDRLRKYMRVFGIMWMFPFALATYCGLSQAAMCFIWHPTWQNVEEVINEQFSESQITAVYVRHHMLAGTKLALMMILLLYTALKTRAIADKNILPCAPTQRQSRRRPRPRPQSPPQSPRRRRTPRLAARQ